MQFYTNFFQYGNQTLIREVRNGCKTKFKHKFSPTLYVPSEKESEFRSIQGDKISPVTFDTVKEARDFISQYKNVDQYQVYGNPRWAYSAVEDLYPSSGKIGIDFDPNHINIVYIDIETASGGEKGFPNIETANHEINAITLGFKNVTYTFGLEEVDFDNSEIAKYVCCKDEYTLLKKFIELWKKIDPDVVTGWNVKFFDLIYIVNRVDRVLGDDESKALSPWSIINKREERVKGKSRPYVEIAGVATLDYIELYKKFKLKMQESYKLDYISYVELGEKKVDYSEYGSLHELYKQDYTQFIRYNIHDVKLVQRLEEKLGYLSLSFVIAYLTKINYEDVFSSIRLWDVVISSWLLKQNTIIPATSEREDSDGYEGAFVKDPLRGKFDWVCSFDLTSLYPSIIRSFNISPDVDISMKQNLYVRDLEFPELTPDLIINHPEKIEALTKFAKENDLAVCANGTFYSRKKKSFLAELMGLMFNERKAAKKQMLNYEKEYEKTKSIESKTLAQQFDAKQNALKIILNSAYGAIGSENFRHYCRDEAMAITITGQTVIQMISKQLNDYMNKILKTNKDYVIANDTDSAYINFSGFVDTFLKGRPESEIADALSKVCETKFQEQIKIAIDRLCEMLNSFENHLDMKREAIGQAVFVAKKRYIMRVHDSEGVRYDTPKMKVVGLEAVRSSTPEFCRKALKDTFELIFTGGEEAVIQKIEETYRDFLALALYDMGEPTGVHDIGKWDNRSDSGFVLGAPAHVKAAITFNRLLKKNKLNNKYETIKDGEKVRVVRLKVPNPTMNDAIAFPSVLPEEFGLAKYIDYDAQFEKAFLSAAKRVTDTIGWKHDRRVSLEDFFS